jgi:hypothetical protein
MVMGERASASTSPVLELRGVSKSFQGTKEGTLQTLIPIVAGRHWPLGRPVRPNSPGGGSASRVSQVEPAARARGDISLEVSTRTFSDRRPRSRSP